MCGIIGKIIVGLLIIHNWCCWTQSQEIGVDCLIDTSLYLAMRQVCIKELSTGNCVTNNVYTDTNVIFNNLKIKIPKRAAKIRPIIPGTKMGKYK